MDIILNNPIVSTVGGLVIGTVGGPILLAAYKSFKVGQYLADGAKGLGEYFGTRTAKRIKQVKDKALRDQLANDIKNAPNDFDKAFDTAFDLEMNK
jgi:hypothetical protein